MFRANPRKNSTVSGTSGRRYLPGEAIEAGDIPEASIPGMLADESIVEETESNPATGGQPAVNSGGSGNQPRLPQPAALKPMSQENRAKLEAKAVSIGIGVPEFVATLTDAELKQKVKEAGK
jgi:acyl CoA:acetate/3-ketoacid CoA transferase